MPTHHPEASLLRCRPVELLPPKKCILCASVSLCCLPRLPPDDVARRITRKRPCSVASALRFHHPKNAFSVPPCLCAACLVCHPTVPFRPSLETASHQNTLSNLKPRTSNLKLAWN